MSTNNTKGKVQADGFIEYLSPKKIEEIKNQVPQKPGDFNPTISPIFKSRSGKSYVSLTIGPEQFDALQRVEVGGKLVIKLRDLTAATSNRQNTVPRGTRKPTRPTDDTDSL